MGRRKSRVGKGHRTDAAGNSIGERFVLLRHYMLKSPAWRTMCPNAKAVLIDVWMRHNGENNGEISYSVREAKAIGLGKSTAGRAFEELLDRGFLRVGRESSFTLKTKEARTWELTAERVGDRPASKDFLRWQPTNKTQSHQRDPQSHQRDREPRNETKLPVPVPPAGPSRHETPSAQSHQRDTSNYHGERSDDGTSNSSSTGRDEILLPTSPRPPASRRRAVPEPERCPLTAEPTPADVPARHY